ncbi:uncharacterized protein LY79DRAFT_201614 [Colletotrichum navitas]|uniref:Uncharacterized protein n=1 Tax=Colletotrichum navitas TaxID=681940 RepID=A0AAD8QBY5_9PEZI|nr:uncharacterized protein LY79DRAFT_201614 [Colletotrichum navitas]KAK1598872.1 hypothetical protein LY79DRAFT_201614 [Colletotrichum navitas]
MDCVWRSVPSDQTNKAVLSHYRYHHTRTHTHTHPLPGLGPFPRRSLLFSWSILSSTHPAVSLSDLPPSLLSSLTIPPSSIRPTSPRLASPRPVAAASELRLPYSVVTVCACYTLLLLDQPWLHSKKLPPLFILPLPPSRAHTPLPPLLSHSCPCFSDTLYPHPNTKGDEQEEKGPLNQSTI